MDTDNPFLKCSPEDRERVVRFFLLLAELPMEGEEKAVSEGLENADVKVTRPIVCSRKSKTTLPRTLPS